MDISSRVVAVSVVLAGLFVFGAGQAWADPITYNIADYPGDQSGWTLSGTITTNGDFGLLAQSDITAWEFTASNGSDTYSLNSSSGAVFVSGTVTASATAITIDNDDVSGSWLYMTDSATPFSTATPLLFYYRDTIFDQYLAWDEHGVVSWNQATPGMGGTDPWVVATVPVPEPGTLALFGLGLIGAALCRRRNA